MELVLRHKKNELCIDHQDGCVGFTVLTEDEKQLDFSVELDQLKQLKTFIDDSIYEYERELERKRKEKAEANAD